MKSLTWKDRRVEYNLKELVKRIHRNQQPGESKSKRLRKTRKIAGILWEEGRKRSPTVQVLNACAC